MRGTPNNLTFGERVAWYRYRRGVSREVLAGLIGHTAFWLGKIENNRIELDRLSVIKSSPKSWTSPSATCSANPHCSPGPATAAQRPSPASAPP
ncbi:helix-turn-helix domain-containing protein [Micromonospora sp. NBC_01405]|uniref:helix-turn-helix domain-containing protein n=1 Tax=Micromonospora sp. NBC_01405 TaxID=2903589 RepID=UPI0032569090